MQYTTVCNICIYYIWCGFRTISLAKSVMWYTEYLMYFFHWRNQTSSVNIILTGPYITYWPPKKSIIDNYYIRLYFTVFLFARSNTRDIPFSNILISKKQFLCNRKAYCTLVQNQWMKLRGTRVQYVFLLHRNCFLLIDMLENGMSCVLLLANRKTVK